MQLLSWSLRYPNASLALCKGLVLDWSQSAHEIRTAETLRCDTQGLRGLLLQALVAIELLVILRVASQHSAIAAVIVFMVICIVLLAIFRTAWAYPAAKRLKLPQPTSIHPPQDSWMQLSTSLVTRSLPVPHRPPR